MQRRRRQLPTALGYYDNAENPDGVHPDLSVVVKYTWLGDTNLDGVVDVANDYFAFLDGLYGFLPGWKYGDLNYDGTVDVANDYFAFLDGLYMQTGPLGAGVAAPLGLATVPEPATLALLGLGAAALAVRRRRR